MPSRPSESYVSFLKPLRIAAQAAEHTLRADTAFHHAPLNQNDFRLLWLQPSDITSYEDSPIPCSLHTFDLDAMSGSYECLSYAWGDSNADNQQILCNGQPFHVTGQLATALTALRPQAPDGPRLLWIDQICINQKDNREKSIQVQLMARIFRQASRVLLFTGMTIDLSLPLQFTEDLARRYSEDEEFQDAWLRCTELELNEQHAVPLSTDNVWIAVRSLFDCACFQRTWILQEITLATDIQLIIGRDTWHLDLSYEYGLCAFVDMLEDRGQSFRTTKRLYPYVGRTIGRIGWILQTRKDFHTEPKDLDLGLFNMLVRSRDLGVTEPRDKIYGLLSMVNDANRIGIVPDYSKSKLECYVAVAAAIIKSTMSLELFGLVERYRHDLSLPSWVPDWTCSSWGWWEYEEWAVEEDSARSTPFSAGLSIELRIRGIVLHALSIQGVLIGTINSLITGLAHPADDDLADIVLGHGLWWLRASHFVGTSYEPTGEPILTALARTFTSDCEEDVACGLNWQTAEFDLGPDERLQDHRLSDIILTSTHGMQMLTTHNKYLGLAPTTAQHDDVIFVLPGSQVPWVLHPVEDNTYRLVGYCYVHGIMYGEAADSEKLEDIVII